MPKKDSSSCVCACVCVCAVQSPAVKLRLRSLFCMYIYSFYMMFWAHNICPILRAFFVSEIFIQGMYHLPNIMKQLIFLYTTNIPMRCRQYRTLVAVYRDWIASFSDYSADGEAFSFVQIFIGADIISPMLWYFLRTIAISFEVCWHWRTR